MTKTCFIRARTKDQIEVRRAEILAAATELVFEQGFDDVSLNGIARRAGIAKSALYRYFGGKEEIFFQIMLHEYIGWFEDTRDRLAALIEPVGDREVAAAMVASLDGREALCHFISVKATVIENNMADDAKARFSEILLGKAAEIVTVLVERLPHLNQADAILFLKSANALIAGLWPMSKHVTVADEIDLPSAEQWQTDFRRDLERAIILVLKGLRAG